ncbi:MAG: ESPR-type extended signal peptide-containing protein, partial [Negativicoccus succinicivorans]|nr:ESPR-type extended signal peptide-containing protein [Negativicoccus succinicivorans]
MNKIYKLVWSKVRSAWVVTSEIAKGHGKDSSSGRNRSMLKAGVVMALLGGFMTAGMINADAALTAEQKAVYEAVLAELKASGKVELGGTTEDTTGIAIGKDSSTSHHMGVAIGEGAKTDNQGNVAIGHKSYSYDSGVAIGTEARADGLNTVAIGDRVTAKNPYSVVISTGKPNTDHRHKYTEAVNSDHATVLGDDSVVGKDNKYGIAIGSAALSDKSESGMAIGRIATVINSEHGIALGRQSEVKNSNGGIVVGPLSKVLNSNKGLAMGDTAHIEDSEGGVAYGPSAYVTDSSDNGVAIGGSTKVKKSFQGIAIGYSASVENAGGAVAVGEYSQANAKTSVAIGSNSRADVAAGQIGYLGDSKTDDVAWKSSLGAVSVGTASSRWGAMTRQITNLAAGTKDTDAVNVAQLKALNTKVD